MSTVKEEFAIDEDDLQVTAEELDWNDFWVNGYDMYMKIKDKPICQISEGQKNYLQKLEDGLKERD